MRIKLLLCILFISCSAACNRTSNNANSAGGGNDIKDERAEIPPELNEQLKALGYEPPGKSARRVQEKDNPYTNVDLAHLMEGMDATFIFLDVQKDIEIVHNADRARTRFSPCSTFKIPNSLIALETGVMTSAMSVIKWDPKKYPKQSFWDDLKKNFGVNWETDHSLQSAFENSCVWCYMEIAERIGSKVMQDHVDRFQYGNQDISTGPWPFWLNSSLKISAREQVAFLKRFVQKDLGLKQNTYEEAKKVFEKQRTQNAVLYAKTGSGNDIGWFVGIVENQGKHFLFAFNMAGDSKAIAEKRVSVSLSALRELGVWE